MALMTAGVFHAPSGSASAHASAACESRCAQVSTATEYALASFERLKVRAVPELAKPISVASGELIIHSSAACGSLRAHW